MAIPNTTIIGLQACWPPEMNEEKFKDIVSSFLWHHPELRKYTAASLVAQALSEAFPCPQIE